MKNKKFKFILIIFIFLFLTGCVTETSIIDDSTTFQQIFDKEGFFSSLFVYPTILLLNNLINKIGLVGALALITFVVNFIMLALTYKSSEQAQIMQTLSPQLTKITKKYEGRTDNNSRMKMAQEQQALYRKHGITNPFSSLLGSFVQIIPLLVLFPSVRRSSAVASSYVLGLEMAVTPFQGITNMQFGYLIIFGIMILFQFGAMKLPMILNDIDAKSKAEAEGKRFVKTANPQAGLTYVMLAIVSMISINMPTAMAIYFACSSIVMILKTLTTRYIAKKRKGDK